MVDISFSAKNGYSLAHGIEDVDQNTRSWVGMAA